MAQRINVDIVPGLFQQTLFFSQGDIGRTFEIDLHSRFGDSLPASPTITIQATKPSGLGFSVAATSINNSVATFTVTDTMTNEAGRFLAEIKVVKNSITLYTANFYIECKASAHPEGTTDGDLDSILPKYVSVTVTTLAPGSSATYTYDPVTNTATFGIPKGDKGDDGTLSSNVIAAAYDATATYAVGDFCFYSGSLYRCTTEISTAEAWTAGHWTVVNVTDEITDLKDDIDKYVEIGIDTRNLLNIGEHIENAYYAGYEEATSSYDYFIVPIISGTTYKMASYVRYLATKSTLIGQNYNPGDTYTATYTGDLYVSMGKSVVTESKIFNSVYNAIEVPALNNYVYNPQTFKKSLNKENSANSLNLLQNGVLKENAYYIGYEEANSSYSYIMVNVEAGEKYMFASNCRFLSNSNSVITQNLGKYTPYTSNFTGVLYVSLYNNERDAWAMYKASNSFIDVPVYDNLDIKYCVNNDVLKNKTWYACGDSFTEGDFTGYTGTYKFTDAPYMGDNMVYPFFIGRRTGCNVKNIASSGSTLAVVSGSTNNFVNIYQNIGADADYITIKYGINDGHQNVPIGTIDSTDTSTFYGAWNTVLTWLINNRPQAKIGIIVSNGLDSDSYATATIAIAKKYGLPYLNEWNGEEVPVLLRSGRTDVDANILQLRTDTWKVSNDNWHPNKECHEYESTFIEAFLKSL